MVELGPHNRAIEGFQRQDGRYYALGVFSPKGYQVRTPAFENHIDTNIFEPDAQEFCFFRFTDRGLDSEDDHVQRARHSWVNARPGYLSFE